MAFVKLDCGILNSTLWVEREARELFITALLMAQPHEVVAAKEQLEVRSLKETGFKVPPGWYGFVPAAGIGIINRAGVGLEEGLSALEKLGGVDPESRSAAFGGRRLVRIDGGYVVLNYMTYRERDYTAAERSKRYREKKLKDQALESSHRNVTTPRVKVTGKEASRRDITHAEAEAEAEAEKPKPIKQQRSDRDILAPETIHCAALRSICERNRVTFPNVKAHMHLGQWANEKLPLETLETAIRHARQQKPDPELIPLTYLVPIVSDAVAGRLAMAPQDAIAIALRNVQASEAKETQALDEKALSLGMQRLSFEENHELEQRISAVLAMREASHPHRGTSA